jgi:hypothetical protein
VDWTGRAIPFVLKVEWEDERGAFGADWPVNVLEPSSLPPPEVLRDLTLDQLIEVLASARPLHVAVVEAVRRRARQSATDSDRELYRLLDPHKRINPVTLLRRTKRVALALERLRERLERPVLSQDALEWRLGGPVGPLALARAFEGEAESPVEARFLLAELALTLSRVRVSEAARGGLGEPAIRAALRRHIGEIETRVLEISAVTDTAIGRYVAEALREAGR